MISLFILSLSIAVTINFTPLYSFDIDYLEITETLKMPKEPYPPELPEYALDSRT